MLYESIGRSDVEWAGMTYAEVRERAERDGSILVVPVASLEQHGPHMPTATDAILAEAVAHAGADRVHPEAPVLVTPPVWTGYSPHHLSFGATVSLEYEHLFWLLDDVVAAAAGNDFDAVLLLNGHGGNAALVSSAAQVYGRAYGDVEVLGLTYFTLARAFIDGLRESDAGGIAHAGEMETSMMLHLRPDLVDEAEIEGTRWELPYDLTAADLTAASPVSMYTEIAEYTDSGALGSPELADAEKGAAMYEAFGDELGAFLLDVHDRHAA
ncbi:creatininase family protein [Haloplanus sp. GCM10025708]|uniref:creatininase family protein n=1 Tax=Haloferacaceae TaxID=1644056 RepID=UPI003620DC6C